MTLGDAIERYRRTVVDLKPSREKTKKAEAWAMAIIARHFGPDTRIDTIRTAAIAQWRDAMLAAGKAPATINRYLATLRAILNRAHKDRNALPHLPSFALPPLNNMRYRFVTADEERRILAVSPPHLRALIIFLIDSGARLSEAVGLTWSDVDLDGPRRAAVRFMRTKNRSPRRVPLTSRSRASLPMPATGLSPAHHTFRGNTASRATIC